MTRGLRGPDHPEDRHNRALLRQRWKQYLDPDISDYCLLAEIEAGEGKTWHWLRDVPEEIVRRYELPDRRTVVRSETTSLTTSLPFWRDCTHREGDPAPRQL